MEYTKERLCNCLDKFNFDNIETEDLVNEIDEEMIPIITELNEKNWITCGCCSGHLEQIKQTGTYSIYICFSDLLNELPKNPPKINKYNNYSFNWIGNKNKSIDENEKERKQLIKDLLKWAKNLPVNNDLSKYDNFIEQQKNIFSQLIELGLMKEIV